MNQYFSQKQFNPIEKPMKELVDLNVKAFQGFFQLNPAELFNVLKPEQVLEKNMEMFVQNGHKALDYMQNMFQIMEKNWVLSFDNLTNNTKQVMKQAQTATQHSMKDAMDVGQRTAKKVVSKKKSVAKKTVPQVKVVARKSTPDAAKKSASANLKGATKPSVSKSNSKPKSMTNGSKKPEVKSMSSYVKETQNTMNKVEPRDSEIKKGNSSARKPDSKEIGSTLNKDRSLF